MSAIETRMTQLEARVTDALASFSPIGVRVGELSSAFQAANSRLVSAEGSIAELLGRGEDERFQLIMDRLALIEQKIGAMQTAGSRGGRLSSRLANIEAALQKLVEGQEGGA
jgi:hypothetical protein